MICDYSYPVRDKVVEAQSIGVCVILSVVHFVVDLRKLESCEIQTYDKTCSKLIRLI